MIFAERIGTYLRRVLKSIYQIRLSSHKHVSVASSPTRAKHRLKLVLVGFFIALALPVYLLLGRIYAQLEYETWFQYRVQAEEVVGRINQRITDILTAEERRPIVEYSFFNVLENLLVQSKGVKYSPLSELPPKSNVPGIIGYFQIKPDGSFNTPLLPEISDEKLLESVSGLSQIELQSRLALREQLRNLLVANKDRERETLNPVAADKLLQRENQTSRRNQNVDEDLHEETRTGVSNQALSEQYAFDRVVTQKKTRFPIATDPAEQDEPGKPDGTAIGTVPSRTQANTLSEEKLRELNIDTERWSGRYHEPPRSRQIFSKNLYQDAIPESRYRRKEQVQLPDQTAASNLLGSISPKSHQAAPTSELAASTATPEVKAGTILTNEQSIETAQKKGSANSAETLKEPVKIFTFETEVDPLQLLVLDDTHFCFFRRVWHNNGRYIQGLVVKSDEFLLKIVGSIFHSSQVGSSSRSLIAYRGAIVRQFEPAKHFNQAISGNGIPSGEEKESLLIRAFLAPPLEDLEILVTVNKLPANPGSLLIDGLTLGLVVVLLGGLIGLYRLGSRQIELAHQQSNFVSSISHELKTPLTSIRMYGEMLRSGWVHDESKRNRYYDFIYFESERLSRLISNVLRLAKLNNGHPELELVEFTPLDLLNLVKQKVISQIEASGFELSTVRPEKALEHFTVAANSDAFCQIFINLVDNALKFSADSNVKRLDIGFTLSQEDTGQIIYFVRDYGPGIKRNQIKKIFQLFYRPQDEMTRTKPGTGIGLALVKQLAAQMNASVAPLNREPGVEFQVKLCVHTPNKLLSHS